VARGSYRLTVAPEPVKEPQKEEQTKTDTVVRKVDLRGLPFRCGEKIKLPDIPGQQNVPSGDIDMQELIEKHRKFYFSDARNSPAAAEKKAKGDIMAVRRAFPTVQDSRILLVMASWYALLCAIDDVIEEMEPALARLALAESIIVLQRTETMYTWQDIIHSPAAFGGRDEEAVCGLAKLFIDQVRSLLPKRVYTRLVEMIIDVWQAMSLETTFKEGHCPGEETYLGVRSRTIGLRPFFVLLEFASCNSVTTVELVEELKKHLAIAIRLQNDILGLRRDLAGGETNNFIVISSLRTDQNLAASTERAVQMHNTAVMDAVDCWHKYTNAFRMTNPQNISYVDSMMGFAQRHFAWASSAGRYDHA
jgi:hypothetical protein